MLITALFFAGVAVGAFGATVAIYLFTRQESSLHAETRRSIDEAVGRTRPAGKLIDARHAFGRRRP
jgi:hypothetical protein